MTYIIASLAVLLAVQTLRAWWYQKTWRASVELNRRLREQVDDFECANELLKKENRQFYKFGTAQRYKAENEWPDEIV